MTNKDRIHAFKAVFSLEPLLHYWKKNVAPVSDHLADLYQDFEERIKSTPELNGPIEDVSILEQYQDFLIPLMSIVFPASSWETEVSGALTPYTSQPVYVSPEFKRLLVNEDGSMTGRMKDDEGASEGSRLLRAYLLILKKVYGIDQAIETPIIRIVKEPKTGLERYFQIIPDLQFTEVRTIGETRELTAEDRKTIIDNIADPEILSRYISAENFEFQGFAVIRAVDVTQSEVISALERNLIGKESIFSTEGLQRVQDQLRILFGRPGLKAWMGALMGDQVFVINDECCSSTDCIFTNSHHIFLNEIKESIWLRAIEKGSALVIPDLEAEEALTLTDQHLLSKGARSMIVSPLHYQGVPIGTLDIVSPKPHDLGPFDTILTRQIAPLFSVALKRGLDEMNSEVESIIKEKCTAVHPSVEWRFRQAALHYMDHLRIGQPVEMEQIVFKSVRPFFAQTDIRGSSEARNRSVQADLKKQLTLARKVMTRAEETKSWPLLQEMKFRIDKQIENVQSGLATGDEEFVTNFLKNEIEPTFDELLKIGPGAIRAIEQYQREIDPMTGVVYRKRREFEDSISILNEVLSSYLDKEEAEAQAIFPHYFEKHQTDGLDYMIYMGASMVEDGVLNPFYIKNLALWQLIVACGMARQTNQIKPELKVPLETCHLILVNRTPISVRFRYEEKRFDVDGAYDIRHEIIKSRIDKATVKGNGERLTQPDRIAVVYSHPEEGLEARRHIEFLQAKGLLMNDLEFLNVEDLSGVKGLQALRIGVNIQDQAKDRSGVVMAGIA